MRMLAGYKSSGCSKTATMHNGSVTDNFPIQTNNEFTNWSHKACISTPSKYKELNLLLVENAASSKPGTKVTLKQAKAMHYF